MTDPRETPECDCGPMYPCPDHSETPPASEEVEALLERETEQNADASYVRRVAGILRKHRFHPAYANELYDIAERLAAAPVEPEPVGWRPIETAPKDGTSVLVFCEDGVVRAAWWDTGFDVQYDHDTEELFDVPAWTDAAVESFGYETLCSYQPTHWMPLPVHPVGSPITEGEG